MFSFVLATVEIRDFSGSRKKLQLLLWPACLKVDTPGLKRNSLNK